MPQFYFHVTSNGQLANDPIGLALANMPAACQHAIEQMPVNLARALQNPDTHVTTQICDEAGMIGVVRATIILEHRRK